jgi:single-stranded DNA-binding protein
MTEASVSFAGNLTDQPEIRYTQGGIARAIFPVTVSGRRCPRTPSHVGWRTASRVGRRRASCPVRPS